MVSLHESHCSEKSPSFYRRNDASEGRTLERQPHFLCLPSSSEVCLTAVPVLWNADSQGYQPGIYPQEHFLPHNDDTCLCQIPVRKATWTETRIWHSLSESVIHAVSVRVWTDNLIKSEKETRFHLHAFVMSFPCLAHPSYSTLLSPIHSSFWALFYSVPRQLWSLLSSPPSGLLCLYSSQSIVLVLFKPGFPNLSTIDV